MLCRHLAPAVVLVIMLAAASALAQPIDETTLEVDELWRIGGDDEEVLIGVVSELLHDDAGNVFILDGQLQEIQVFDPDGVWLRTIGREGEGPGEFRNSTDMFWLPSGQIGVIQSWPGKIITLWPDGTPGDLFALPFKQDGGFQTASRGMRTDGGVVLSGSAWTREGEQQYMLSYLATYAVDGTELAHFHDGKRKQDYGNWKFQEAIYIDFQRRWTAAADGRVAAALSFADYRIHVWHPDGSLDVIIERPDYEPVARNADEIAMFQTVYDQISRWNPGSTFEVSPLHQTVGRLFFREDGSLWVQSSRDQWRAPDGRFTSFDVYDREGRYVQRVHLDLEADATRDGIFFSGDRLYVVTDLLSALWSSFGADGDGEAEPVSVIAFSVKPTEGAITRAH